MLPNDRHPGPGCSCGDCLRKFPDSERSQTPPTSNPRSLHFAEMLDRAETFSDRERGELADLLRAMTFEGGEAETCIERLTRERDTWRGHYQDLLDDAASVRQEMIRRDAERDRLRAALERIKRIGPLGVDTYPECYRRMHAIAVAALSGEPTSAVETNCNQADTAPSVTQGLTAPMPRGSLPNSLGNSSEKANRNQAASSSSGDDASTPVARGNLPNSLAASPQDWDCEQLPPGDPLTSELDESSQNGNEPSCAE